MTKRRVSSFLSSLLLLLIDLTCSQIPSLGRCPDLQAVKNFNMSRVPKANFLCYLGKFYEIEKYFSLFDLGGICVTTKYTDLGNDTLGISVSKTQALSRQRNTINGTARMIDKEDGSAKFTVKFPNIPWEIPYWIIDTNYDDYSLVWSCNSFTIVNFQIVWFLSRRRFPDEDIKQRVYNTIKSLGLRRSMLMKTELRKCPETF